jgi:hypothetical protein
LLTVLLVDQTLEFRRDFESPLLVDPSWVIAAEHIVFGLLLRPSPALKR